MSERSQKSGTKIAELALVFVFLQTASKNGGNITHSSMTFWHSFSEIQNAYTRCGWRIKFLMGTGVSNVDGEAIFFSDNNLPQMEWGGKIVPVSKELKGEESFSLQRNLIWDFP